jgi:hypothetical protein
MMAVDSALPEAPKRRPSGRDLSSMSLLPKAELSMYVGLAFPHVTCLISNRLNTLLVEKSTALEKYVAKRTPIPHSIPTLA